METRDNAIIDINKHNVKRQRDYTLLHAFALPIRTISKIFNNNENSHNVIIK